VTGHASASPKRSSTRSSGCRVSVPSGFSLVELVVVIGIVALLVGFLLPGLREVRESMRRLTCANHMRSIGIAIATYQSDFSEQLPFSRMAEAKRFRELMAVTGGETPDYDGLGFLLPFRHLDSPGCLFCPSHCGDHEADVVRPKLRPTTQRLYGNYHFRGHLDRSGNRLKLAHQPDTTVLITDGMRTRSDFNHVKGSNILTADLAVRWWYDRTGTTYGQLLDNPEPSDEDPSFVSFFEGLLERIGTEVR